MAKTDYDEKRVREAIEREAIQIDDSLARIDGEIYHKELYRALPLKAILSGLSEYEMRLVHLNIVDGMSAEELALVLRKDISRIGYDLNKLRVKIRARAKRLLQEDEAANKLMLTWEQIHAKRNRIAS